MLYPLEMLSDTAPSPIQEWQDSLFIIKNIRAFIKRDDRLQLSPTAAFCGNKWRKLKYNLLEARRLEYYTLITFGGAYSNHLAAVAEAGQLFGFHTIGIVRGEPYFPLNPTLQFCVKCGMELQYVTREDYKNKNDTDFINKLDLKLENYYILPEGGTNDLAIKGCQQIVMEIESQLTLMPDYIAVACGTGGTLAGIAAGLKGKSKAIGFSVLKEVTPDSSDVTSFNTNYHFGGYAKFTPELIHFINHFKRKHGIALDPIYTGKLFFGLYDLIQNDYFPSGSTIVAIHTGGLQGIAGFNERHNFILQ